MDRFLLCEGKKMSCFGEMKALDNKTNWSNLRVVREEDTGSCLEHSTGLLVGSMRRWVCWISRFPCWVNLKGFGREQLRTDMKLEEWKGKNGLMCLNPSLM